MLLEIFSYPFIVNNYNKTFHKGKYRSREWAKHLRPFLKRTGNKRWRKTGLEIEEDIPLSPPKKKKPKKIKVKITKSCFGNIKLTSISKYKNLRDAKNAMKQGNVIRARIIDE